MPSLQTICRGVLMVAVGVVAVKAWRLYGPTDEQVKTVFTQAVEMVQSALQSRQQESADAAPDPRIPMPRASDGAPSAAAPPATAPAAPLAQTEAPKLLPEGGASAAVPPIQPPATAPPEKAALANNDDRMPELMTRLQQLGAADTNLAPWGSSGNLYRFSCRAPLASAPTMTQHFESVAAEPVAAVEQVLAKVEAWRVAQRDGGKLRF